jgi:hypothetical protein
MRGGRGSRRAETLRNAAQCNLPSLFQISNTAQQELRPPFLALFRTDSLQACFTQSDLCILRSIERECHDLGDALGTGGEHDEAVEA